MHTIAPMLGLVVLAYLLGSIPFGLVVGLAKGVDPRKAGSGNIGATNVGRLLGKKYFTIVFVLDLLKGLVPMVLAAILLMHEAATAVVYLLWIAVGFAAICGHVASIFLKFKGGKGVSTSAGVVLGVWPYYTLPAVVAIVLFLVLLRTTRYMSIASMGGAIAFTLAYVAIGLAMHWPMFGPQWPLLAFAVIVAVMILFKHRGNVRRLLAGSENRLGSSKTAASRNSEISSGAAPIEAPHS
jgi:acyl phosphate:glycerol-3-phosphate acyltransferase